MAYTAIPPTSAGGAGVISTALSRAQFLTQSTPSAMSKVLGEDFSNDQWYRLVAVNTGAPAINVTERGGVVTLPTGAGASSFAVIFPHGTTNIHIDNPQTTKWYIRGRVKMTTAVDAQASLYFGLATAGGGNPLMNIGLLGNLSTGFISTSTTNNAGAVQASTVSAVAYETTLYHIVEAWNNSTTIGAAWDGVQIFSTPNTNYGTNPVVTTAVTGNGTTAANRSMLIDYMFTCVADP